jgi:hypothetical protein
MPSARITSTGRSRDGPTLMSQSPFLPRLRRVHYRQLAAFPIVFRARSGLTLSDQSLEVVSKPPHDDQRASEAKKRVKETCFVLVSDKKSSEVEQPSEGTLYDPASAETTQLSTILVGILPIRLMRNDKVDTPSLHALPEVLRIVTLVSDDSVGPLAGTTWPGTWYGYFRERFFREVRLGSTGRRKVHSERNTLAVDQYHALCPLTFTCFSDARAPFLAAMNEPSMNASLQSSWPCSSSWARNARQRASHTPSFSHFDNRRQHVAGLGYASGRSFHRAPVRKIQRIPSKQLRSSAAGRPPLGFGLLFGRCGSIRAHCSSVSLSSLFILRYGSRPVIYATGRPK